MTEPVSHWTEDVVPGPTTAIGTAHAAVTRSYPAGARLSRVVLDVVVGGNRQSTTGPNDVMPVYYLPTIWIEGDDYPRKRIFKESQLLDMCVTFAYDPDRPAGLKSIYTAWWGGGAPNLGANLQTSYGGPGTSGLAIELNGGFFYTGIGVGSSALTRNIALRTLYYL